MYESKILRKTPTRIRSKDELICKVTRRPMGQRDAQRAVLALAELFGKILHQDGSVEVGDVDLVAAKRLGVIVNSGLAVKVDHTKSTVGELVDVMKGRKC